MVVPAKDRTNNGQSTREKYKQKANNESAFSFIK